MQSEFNQIIKKEIINKHLVSFLDTQAAVSIGFRKHGWIAGGFAREIFKCYNNNSISFENYLFEKNGDIDFFFSEDPTEHLECMTWATEFARNYLNNKVKVQFVTAFIYKNIEKTFEAFDFYNSCYAITLEKEKYYIYYAEKAVELDIKKELGVKTSNSPYTLQRIVKYLSSRDTRKISKDSDDIVYDIIVKAACESFDSKFKYYIFKPFARKSLERLINLGIVSKEDIVLFLGKYSVTHKHSNYGLAFETKDWAMSILEEDAMSANRIVAK